MKRRLRGGERAVDRDRSDMDLAGFLRAYPLRAERMMWFLGAGASSAAGVPTAFDMIWQFKRALYCSEQRISIGMLPDLSDSQTRARLQRHFDDSGGYPPAGAPEEYAAYFEKAYPDEGDRRRVIDDHARSARPSYGHLALARLLRQRKAGPVWTTNFDRVIEDALNTEFGGTASVVVATPDTARVAREALGDGRSPLVVKLHGDFQSRRLKNTLGELHEQDKVLRSELVDASRHFGLVVVGYAGRDASVMESLAEGLHDGRGYPHGLFWFHRPDLEPLPSVRTLIARAHELGVSAHLIELETFNELLGDVIEQMPDLAQTITIHRSARPHISPAPLPPPGAAYPVIRFNALHVESWPVACRRIDCDIGGFREVREAVGAAGAEVIAGRRSGGVIAFGPDSEIRRVFEPFGIHHFDLHPIEAGRLRYADSAELGLLYDALCRALARERGLVVARRRSTRLLLLRADAPGAQEIKQITGAVGGLIAATSLSWSEAIAVRLDYRLDQLWLLIEPTVVVDVPHELRDEQIETRRKEFVRERLAKRYNRDWFRLVSAWARLLTGGLPQATVRAFGIGDGVDAAFTVSASTAFSRAGRTQG